MTASDTDLLYLFAIMFTVL